MRLLKKATHAERAVFVHSHARLGVTVAATQYPVIWALLLLGMDAPHKQRLKLLPHFPPLLTYAF